MNKTSPYQPAIERIFDFNISEFDTKALEIFAFQYTHNAVYRRFCDLLRRNPSTVKTISQIPFLPVSFFKTHPIQSTHFTPEVIFESSGTTQTISSRHYVKDVSIYTKSFLKGFAHFYGNPNEWCIIGLLPSYLERQHSSLVMMADELIRQSQHECSGFYLYEHQRLAEQITRLEQQGQKTLLIGVTFALLDFAEKYPVPMKHTVVMETGGMKGRKTEMTRQEVHARLKEAFQLSAIHSEYGMTELLSQAYSKENGIFRTPPWMRILIRNEDDPLEMLHPNANRLTGVVNIVDFANVYSCSFIATDDAGRLFSDGSFEILGRIDNSDIRGCSLMAV